MGNSIKAPKKLKIELLYDLKIPLLDIYLKKMKILNQKDKCTLMFIVLLFQIGNIQKQSKRSSTNE